MKHLRFSYVVLALCAGLLIYGLVIGLNRTSALFLDVRDATGLVDAGDSFPTTPTEGPTVVPTRPAETPTVVRTGTPGRTATVVRTGTPARTGTPVRITTAAPGATDAAETAAPATTRVAATAAAQETEPVEAAEPEQVVAENTPPEPEIESASEPEVRAEPTSQEPTVASSVPTTASAAVPSATRVAEVAAAVATLPSGQVGDAPAATGDCGDAQAVLSFGDDASYSGPGPFNAFALVMNTGSSPATNVVLAFEVIEGEEFFHEAVFGNGQLWWAHGAPDAGVIYVVPEVRAGGSAGVRFVATMRPEWSGAARMVIRVSLVAAECAQASRDEALLTFSATAPDAGVAAPTATGVAAPTIAPTPMSTVLGAEANPTGAVRATAQEAGTATPPSGEILPEGGDGAGGDGASSAALVVAAVAIALLFLGIGVVAGRLAPR